jgi:hypothetical protein
VELGMKNYTLYVDSIVKMYIEFLEWKIKNPVGISISEFREKMNLMTPSEVCELLKISQDTFKKYERDPSFPVIKISHDNKFIRKEELLEWLKEKRDK